MNYPDPAAIPEPYKFNTPWLRTVREEFALRLGAAVGPSVDMWVQHCVDRAIKARDRGQFALAALTHRCATQVSSAWLWNKSGGHKVNVSSNWLIHHLVANCEYTREAYNVLRMIDAIGDENE